jgi:hypothetical protein
MHMLKTQNADDGATNAKKKERVVRRCIILRDEEKLYKLSPIFTT